MSLLACVLRKPAWYRLPALLALWSLPALVVAATLAVCTGPVAGAAAVYAEDANPVTLLVADLSPGAGNCTVLTLPIAASAIRWSSLSDLPLAAGAVPATIALQGLFGGNTVSVSDISWTRPDAAPPAPAPAATTLVFDPAAASLPRLRAGWFWAPALWQQEPELLWSAAREQGLTRLYLSVPVTPAGEVADTALLSAFIVEATARGLEVWAVAGDPRDVLEESLPALLQRSAAYTSYNTAAAAEAALGGLQLDIEPYLLQGFALAQDHWRERYLQTIRAVHAQLAQRLPLDLVLPVWWGAHPAWGERLLSGLALPATTLTVMNYRTDVARLQNDALPFLVWGQQSGGRVTVALEAGAVGPDEVRRTYADSGSGELWLLPVGTHRVLLLLDAPAAGLPGRAWRQVREQPMPASDLSFGGDLGRLYTTAALLEQEWLRWSSYAGIAIHGLEEQYPAAP